MESNSAWKKFQRKLRERIKRKKIGFKRENVLGSFKFDKLFLEAALPSRFLFSATLKPAHPASDGYQAESFEGRCPFRLVMFRYILQICQRQ